VWQLVLSHRDRVGTVGPGYPRPAGADKPQEAVIVNLFALKLAKLLFKGGAALQPGNRRDHRQEQEELGMLLYLGLAKEDGPLRIQARH